MSVLVDDRTPEQKKSHPVVILGTDRFLSGWGHADGGNSYAGWACRYEDADRVERWVRRRGDQQRVRVVGNDYRPGPSCAHCHIYVVEAGHPAIGGVRP